MPKAGRGAVYVYDFFDNDIKVYAPFDALALHRVVGYDIDPHGLQDAEGNPSPPHPA